MMAINVPKKAYMRIDPMLLKKTRLKLKLSLLFHVVSSFKYDRRKQNDEEKSLEMVRQICDVVFRIEHI